MLLRLAGYLFLCVALAAAAFDGMRIIADKGALSFTSLLQHWETLNPHGLAATRATVEAISSWLWSPVLMSVLVLPAWILAGGLGVALYLAGYRRPRPSLPDGI
jgi:hypothetical protein